MGGGALSADNPTVVSAFHVALAHQGMIVLGIALVVAVAWNLLRVVQLRRTGTGSVATVGLSGREPAGRRWLRVGFGLFWLVDGILQAQSAMPLGMIPNVVQPAATSSPAWVQHLLAGPAQVWTYHPVTAAAAAVWIQVGIGLWLLVAPRGEWSRLGGLASVAWGLLVWIFGEAFGGIFAPGLTWLLGAPGAALFYAAAGAVVALPERWWAGTRMGKVILRVMGGFLVGMALLQAWPGRGFWEGTVHGRPAGSLTQMIAQMAGTPQPKFLSGWLSTFASFDAAHGFAGNVVAVAALALIGAGLLIARPAFARAAVAAGVVVCLADWVMVEDLGFLGGTGTDPNSMIPMALVMVAGYVALTRPAVAADPTVVPIVADQPAAGWRQRLIANPGYAIRALAALGALGVTLVGAAPMAVAATRSHADPILAEAADGPVQPSDLPAHPFGLVDQHGRQVSLASLRGKTVALTFLDDTCTVDCPLIAQEFRLADGYLGSLSKQVMMVAININPRFISPDYLAAFDQQEGMDHLANWRYLTGTLPQLQAVWKAYGEPVFPQSGGAMVGHGDYAWIIDPAGRVRYFLDSNPGDGAAFYSSFAQLLSTTIARVAHQ
jgi:cytochrome oxidase Cu insertion factor (SCO1/SenC/PrrC family)